LISAGDRGRIAGLSRFSDTREAAPGGLPLGHSA